MRYNLLTILLFVIVLTSGCKAPDPKKGYAKAQAGFVDLSNWDFEKDGIIKLDGGWEFYWMKLYTPSDFDTLKLKPELIDQPTNWIVKKINGQNLPNFGYATYRLKIKINPKYLLKNEDKAILRIKLIEAHSASTLWAGRSKIIENGVVVNDPDKFYPRVKPEAASFNVSSDTVAITINVANYFDSYMAGIDDHILLGTDTQLLKETKDNEFLYLISFSILLVLSVYHIVIYIVRRKEPINLYFSAACFIFAIQSFVVGEKTIYYFFPWLSTVAYYKIWLSTLLIFPFLTRFYQELFPNEIKNWALRLINLVFGLYFLIVIFTKHSVYISIEPYVLYFSFFIVVYLIYSVIKAIRKKRPFAAVVLFCMIIPFIAGVNDILFGLDLIVTGYYGPVGFLILILSHSLIVTTRLAKAYEKSEILGDELLELNKTLEQKVNERTAELNQAYNDLKATNATKNKIFSIIAHDLKNIFQALIGYSEIIAMDSAEAEMESVSKDAMTLKKTAKKAYFFFENMLEWSSSQTGMMKYNPENLNANQLVFECMELLTMQAKGKKIDFAINVANNLGVFADKRMVTTILRNLIQNAIKFSHKGGRITIKAYEEEGNVCFTVQDGGVGMDEETVSQLFVMERMSSKKGTASETGTGLGLLLAKEFIEANKGTLTVTSKQGDGSTFTFTLPAGLNKN